MKVVDVAVRLNDDDGDDDDSMEDEEIDVAAIKDVASFKFDGVLPKGLGLGSAPIAGEVSPSSSTSSALPVEKEDGSIPLPDIKDTLRRKELEQQMALMEEEQQEKKKINRKDRKALLKVRPCDRLRCFFNCCCSYRKHSAAVPTV